MGPSSWRRRPGIAILDRLLHHCDVININGPSYRLKDRLTLVTGGEPMP
jgi:DNA replication protein DnaC